MKDVRINGRMARVFVLKETSDRLVYIPLKSIHRVDYDRLLEIETISTRTKVEMLDVMSNHKLDNGRNALLQYDSIIQVMQKTSNVGSVDVGERLKKPEEAIVQFEVKEAVKAAAPVQQRDQQAPAVQVEPVKERRKPGPKPKVKQDE